MKMFQQREIPVACVVPICSEAYMAGSRRHLTGNDEAVFFAIVLGALVWTALITLLLKTC